MWSISNTCNERKSVITSGNVTISLNERSIISILVSVFHVLGKVTNLLYWACKLLNHVSDDHASGRLVRLLLCIYISRKFERFHISSGNDVNRLYPKLSVCSDHTLPNDESIPIILLYSISSNTNSLRFSILLMIDHCRLLLNNCSILTWPSTTDTQCRVATSGDCNQFVFVVHRYHWVDV